MDTVWSPEAFYSSERQRESALALPILINQHSIRPEGGDSLACSTRPTGFAENDINCGHFDCKCNFMWRNHAYYRADLFRK